MKPGLTASRAKSKGSKKPRAGSAHNRDLGARSLIGEEMKRRMRFDIDLANPSKVEKEFLQARQGSPEQIQRAMGVVKKVRKLHKKQGVKI